MPTRWLRCSPTRRSRCASSWRSCAAHVDSPRRASSCTGAAAPSCGPDVVGGGSMGTEMHTELRFDYAREARSGLPEAVLCSGKTTRQLRELLDDTSARRQPLLLTRLSQAQRDELPHPLDYD